MSNSFTQLYVHFVFTVKDRDNELKTNIKDWLYPALHDIANEQGCKIIALNGMEDHVHILVSMSPDVSVAVLAKALKGKSSYLANQNHVFPRKFSWQAGYAAFSVSHSMLDVVMAYIRNQQDHHRQMTANEEFQRFLSKHNLKSES